MPATTLSGGNSDQESISADLAAVLALEEFRRAAGIFHHPMPRQLALGVFPDLAVFLDDGRDDALGVLVEQRLVGEQDARTLERRRLCARPGKAASAAAIACSTVARLAIATWRTGSPSAG